MSAKAGRHDDQYMVRFPPGLRDKIKQAASDKGRSMNSEIIDRLEASFAFDGELGEHEADMKAIKQSVEDLKQLFMSLREDQKA